MTWMLTANGAVLDLKELDGKLLDIEVIAKSLSGINRFNAHALRHLSVAEHCILVTHILERGFHVTDPAVLLAGLMREAHKSITGDLSWGMQRLIYPVWESEECRIRAHVMTAFGLQQVWHMKWGTIAAAHLHALSCERAQLMPQGGPEWPCMESHPPLPWVDLTGAHAACTPDDWREAFLQRFHELNAARQVPAPSTSA